MNDDIDEIREMIVSIVDDCEQALTIGSAPGFSGASSNHTAINWIRRIRDRLRSILEDE